MDMVNPSTLSMVNGFPALSCPLGHQLPTVLLELGPAGMLTPAAPAVEEEGNFFQHHPRLGQPLHGAGMWLVGNTWGWAGRAPHAGLRWVHPTGHSPIPSHPWGPRCSPSPGSP